MEYEKIARRIAEASKNNSLTFFVGAGVSKCSGVPNWKELIEKMCVEIKRPIPKEFSSDEYLSIPQMFYYSLNGDKKRYRDFVKSAIDRPNVFPNEIHRMMLNFHPASFLTTNYDSLLEEAAIEYCQSFKCIVKDEEVPSINGDRFILKVHGDFAHENFVLKEEDYLAYEDNFKLIATLMRSVFSTNTVVFIGYRIGDYNVKLIIDWVRRILKDRFHPIFIRVEDEPLSEEETKYYISRGLDVIELSKITSEDERKNFPQYDYVPRYTAVLRYIETITREKTIGGTDEESFSILYDRLAPLDKMSALRISDIQTCLSKNCRISNTGTIDSQKGQESLFRKFISINEMSAEELENISENEKRKYRLIRRVLNKGRVYQVYKGEDLISIKDMRTKFADDMCVDFDYSGMASYCKKTYKDINARLKKAFYLTRLYRYEEAFDLFLEIAKESFRKNEFVYFYLAEVNCIILRKAFKNPYFQFYRSKQIQEKEEEIILWENENDLFDSLPQEFRIEYKSFRDLCTKNFLYQYGFEGSVEAKKLEESLSKHTIEWGETTSGIVASKLNEYLHFLLGNGVCFDLFLEYKSTVCILMEKLLHKYSEQQRKSLNYTTLFEITESKICFNQYDFYCFIRFFKASELKNILEKNRCKSIKFNDMKCIENAIRNLLKNTEKVIKGTQILLERNNAILEMETFLVLSRYMDLSEGIIEEICRFIFKDELIDITIDQKILFLDAQVFSRHVSNEKIDEILENALIKSLDKHISSFSDGNEWNLASKSADINYPNIADYLYMSKKEYVSRRLSKRVSIIIEKQIINMQKEVIEHYLSHVSKEQKRQIKKWIEKMLFEKFDFYRFTLLIEIDSKRAKRFSEQLFTFLENKENQPSKEESSKIYTFPQPVQHVELLNVGIWCRYGILDSKKFLVFKGIDAEFDFLIDPVSFDYSLFNVAWLFGLHRNVIKVLNQKKTVKNGILKAILREIKNDGIKQEERERLIRIMSEYYSD